MNISRNNYIIALFFSILCNLTIISSSMAFTNHSPEIQSYIKELLDKTLNILKNDSTTVTQKMQFSQNLMRENMDLNFMARASLGRMAKQFSQKDLQRYTLVYSDFVLKSYSSNVKSYNNQSISVTQTINIGGNDYRVSTAISMNNRSPLKVDYIVRKTPAGFRVIDIVTEGVSLVYTQQSEFTNLIRNNNNSLDVLIQRLDQQIQNIK